MAESPPPLLYVSSCLSCCERVLGEVERDLAGIANSQTDNQTTRDCHVGKSDKRLSAITMEKSIYNHKKKLKGNVTLKKKRQAIAKFP